MACHIRRCGSQSPTTKDTATNLLRWRGIAHPRARSSTPLGIYSMRSRGSVMTPQRRHPPRTCHTASPRGAQARRPRHPSPPKRNTTSLPNRSSQLLRGRCSRRFCGSPGPRRALHCPLRSLPRCAPPPRRAALQAEHEGPATRQRSGCTRRAARKTKTLWSCLPSSPLPSPKASTMQCVAQLTIVVMAVSR